MIVAITTGMDYSKENWRPCPGFEQDYAVSDLGRVKRTSTATCTFNGYVLSTFSNSRYGANVKLYARGRCLNIKVYRLVALTWVPNPQGFLVVGAVNGDFTDCRAANLYWKQHCGGRNRCSGADHPRAALTMEQARAIRASDQKQAVLSKQFGVSQALISKIRNGHRYRELDHPVDNPSSPPRTSSIDGTPSSHAEPTSPCTGALQATA